MTETASKDLRVDIISDVVCPWCIIGYRQLEEAANAAGKSLDVHWHPYELNPHMPAEGQNLREHITEKYGTSADDSAKMREMITQTGKELGFSFDFQPESRIMNTLQAHKLIQWAESKDRQHELKMVLIRRYFTDHQDVSQEDILLAAIEEVGLNKEEAIEVLKDEKLSALIRETEHFWQSKGVQGVPSMVFNQRHLVTGAQGVDTYSKIIEQLTAEQNTKSSVLAKPL